MYSVGSVARLTGTFKDATGALVDPTAVTVTITKPDGTNPAGSPFTAAKDSTGVYHYDYTTTVAGVHQFYFTGTGSNAAVLLPDVFTVAPLTTAALISLADARQALNDTTNSIDDGELLLAIRAATEIINELAGYTVATSVTETVDSTIDRYGRGVIMLSHVPVMTVQTIVGTLLGAPTVTVDPAALDVATGEYILGVGGFYGPQTVTYTAGRAAVPAALQEACRIQVQALWETQQGGASIPELGDNEESPDQSMYGLDLRVLQLIKLAGHSEIAGVA